MKQKIEEWLNLARWAPSGGNSQPWLAEIHESPSRLILSIDPVYIAQRSPLDQGGFASAVALGCVAKNLEIIALSENYRAEISLLKQENIWNAQVCFHFYKVTETPKQMGIDRSHISSRFTNRNLYSKEPIAVDFLSELNSLKEKCRLVELSFSNQKIDQLLPQLISIENILWKNKIFLDSRLAEIIFKKTDSAPEKGIPANQLGLSRIDQRIFEMIKKSKILRNFFVLFFYRIAVTKGLKKTIRASGGIGFIQAKDRSFAASFELGQIFQHLWLLSTKYGLGFQPISTFLAALAYWDEPQTNLYNPDEAQIIRQATEETRKKSKLDITKSVLGFRVGYTNTQPPRSGRAPFKIIYSESETK